MLDLPSAIIWRRDCSRWLGVDFNSTKNDANYPAQIWSTLGQSVWGQIFFQVFFSSSHTALRLMLIALLSLSGRLMYTLLSIQWWLGANQDHLPSKKMTLLFKLSQPFISILQPLHIPHTPTSTETTKTASTNTNFSQLQSRTHIHTHTHTYSSHYGNCWRTL